MPARRPLSRLECGIHPRRLIWSSTRPSGSRPASGPSAPGQSGRCGSSSGRAGPTKPSRRCGRVAQVAAPGQPRSRDPQLHRHPCWAPDARTVRTRLQPLLPSARGPIGVADAPRAARAPPRGVPAGATWRAITWSPFIPNRLPGRDPGRGGGRPAAAPARRHRARPPNRNHPALATSASSPVLRVRRAHQPGKRDGSVLDHGDPPPASMKPGQLLGARTVVVCRPADPGAVHKWRPQDSHTEKSNAEYLCPTNFRRP